MKKLIIYISFLLTAFTVHAQANNDAQPNGKRGEKIKALYIAYITQQLTLSPTEAEKFWPAHTQYENELMAVNRGNTNELDRQQSVLNIKKKYQPSFNKIIGTERTNQFYKSDEEFRKKLVDRLKQIRQQRGADKPNKRFQRQGFIQPD